MTSRRYQKTLNRQQEMLLPVRVEEYVSENNSVRAIDAYVNTACPRVSLEATGKFQKPVLTVNEFMVVCGESSWENMLKKGLFEN